MHRQRRPRPRVGHAGKRAVGPEGQRVRAVRDDGLCASLGGDRDNRWRGVLDGGDLEGCQPEGREVRLEAKLVGERRAVRRPRVDVLRRAWIRP